MRLRAAGLMLMAGSVMGMAQTVPVAHTFRTPNQRLSCNPTTRPEADAPRDQKGEPRMEFFSFRNTSLMLTGIPSPLVAQRMSASLWRNLPQPVNSKKLLTMEDLDQSNGYVLYRTGLDAGDGGELVLDGLQYYAQVYIDQTLVGVLDRHSGTYRLTLPVMKAAATLDILVTTSDREKSMNVIGTEHKGLRARVTVGGKEPKRWEIYSLPIDDLKKLRFLPGACEGPCSYRTNMKGAKPGEARIGTIDVQNGDVWVGQRATATSSSVGSQPALYTPVPWLREVDDDVVKGAHGNVLSSTAESIFARPAIEKTAAQERE